MYMYLICITIIRCFSSVFHCIMTTRLVETENSEKNKIVLIYNIIIALEMARGNNKHGRITNETFDQIRVRVIFRKR